MQVLCGKSKLSSDLRSHRGGRLAVAGARFDRN